MKWKTGLLHGKYQLPFKELEKFTGSKKSQVTNIKDIDYQQLYSFKKSDWKVSVANKDLTNNILVAVQGNNHPLLMSKELDTRNLELINPIKIKSEANNNRTPPSLSGTALKIA